MKFPRAALLIASLVTVSIAVPAYAATNPAWHGARHAVLPTGATGVYGGFLPYLSCPSARNCVAGGVYVDSAGNDLGLLLNEVNGVWRSPTSLTPPANAVVKDGVSISGISCGSMGRCSAVGTYYDAALNQLSFIADEVGGKWLAAKEVALPANAAKSGQASALRSVSCSSPGYCSAVGTYDVAASPSPTIEGFVVNELGGTWSAASEVGLPAGIGANPYVSLNQIACGSTGNCSAVGSYIDANNVTHTLVVNEVARSWRPAISTSLPGNASSFAGAALSEVACASAGNCSAVGTYNATGAGVEALVANEVHGAWARASGLRMPASAGANPQALLFGFQGISCATPGNCATGGQYLDKTGKYQGFLVNEISGRWQASTELALPGGATQTSHNGGVVSLSCQSPGNCSAGAAYLDAAGRYQAMIVNETGHVWKAASRLALPSNAAGVGIGGGVYALVCQKSGVCDAVGSYLSGATNYSAFTVGAP
jgi:hypothetical protein